MKTVYLARHAKSSWADTGMEDFDRPLNDRGKKDAPLMAKQLVAKGRIPDCIISSPAKRAKKTAKIFSETLDVAEKDIRYIDKLYLAPPSVFYDLIENLEDRLKQVMIVAHNPGITDLANEMTPDVHIDNIPTCGIFAIEAAVDNWKDFAAAEKNFLFFHYPKAL